MFSAKSKRKKVTLISFCVFFQLMAGISFSREKSIVINCDMQYQYAEECFDNGEYKTAILEFKRFIHFFPKEKRVTQAQFKTGASFFYLKQYSDAVEFFQQLSSSFSQDQVSVEARFMLSRTYLMMEKSGSAERVLQNFLTLTNDKSIKERIYSAIAWIYLKRAGEMGACALDSAECWFDRISSSGAEYYNKNEITKEISQIRTIDKKNPVIAGTAALIPGAGFAYCERYRDALITFLLNTSLILAAAESFDDGNNALGAVISFVEAGFYSGNIYGSISSAHKYNRFKIEQRIHQMEKKYHGKTADFNDRKRMLSFQITF
ncbi:MAG: hypothetical protein U9N77_12615 [Thermodesulfobacteriota bacterium]|nr:hypothetical protein [Thermodesulfobacteriota bacterium]